MEEPAPGQFDFSQQKRTFKLELLRSVPQGLVTTAATTFVIFIANRDFDMPSRMKAMMLASSSVGLLLSLFVVQWIRRSGWTVNRTAASLWGITGIGFVMAAFSGDRQWLYFTGICMGFVALGAGMPLLSQIYRKHYSDEKRGRLFSISSLLRSTVAAAAGWGFGIWLQGSGFQMLFVTYGLSCFVMAYCVSAMAPVRLRLSNRIVWFEAFRHAGEDRPFRKLLIVWMILGLGNLISIALFVEYISNPRYGYACDADQSGFITSTIPMIAMMVGVLPWGWVFDRVPFYRVRALVNLFFIIGVLVYFLGDSLLALGIGIAIHGIARSGGEILWSLWTTRFAESDRVAEYQSVHSFLTGVRGVMAPLIAFAVVENLGPSTVAWISAALMGIATVMIFPEIRAESRKALSTS